MNRRGFLFGAAALPLAPVLAKVAAAFPVAPTPPIPIPMVATPAASWGMTINEELAALTRAAFVPKLTAQIYRTAPLLSAMTRNNAHVILPILETIVP